MLSSHLLRAVEGYWLRLEIEIQTILLPYVADCGAMAERDDAYIELKISN